MKEKVCKRKLGCGYCPHYVAECSSEEEKKKHNYKIGCSKGLRR